MRMVLIFAWLCAVLCGVRGEGVSWIVKIIRLRAGGGSFPFLPRIPTVSLPWRSFAFRSTGTRTSGRAVFTVSFPRFATRRRFGNSATRSAGARSTNISADHAPAAIASMRNACVAAGWSIWTAAILWSLLGI